MIRLRPSKRALLNKIGHARLVMQLCEEQLENGLRTDAPRSELERLNSTIDAQKRHISKLSRRLGH